jgi:hypothetical protein
MNTTVESAMTKFEKIKSIPMTAVMDESTMADLLGTGK